MRRNYGDGIGGAFGVVCVTATRGELGVTDPTRWPPDQLPAIREVELADV